MERKSSYFFNDSNKNEGVSLTRKETVVAAVGALVLLVVLSFGGGNKTGPERPGIFQQSQDYGNIYKDPKTLRDSHINGPKQAPRVDPEIQIHNDNYLPRK